MQKGKKKEEGRRRKGKKMYLLGSALVPRKKNCILHRGSVT